MCLEMPSNSSAATSERGVLRLGAGGASLRMTRPRDLSHLQRAHDPLSARIVGDANGDGNTYNDRLPGYRRNAFTGPDYMTADLRIARRLVLHDRWKLELLAESFNLANRANRRVDISDDGFLNTAASFVPGDVKAGNKQYPASYRATRGFL